MNEFSNKITWKRAFAEVEAMHKKGLKKQIQLENKCSNCHDMELYPDEQCPDCGREV